MMRHLYLLMTIILLSLGCQFSDASPIKFVNTIPENGSEISTFDIKFQFDISKNIEEQGSDNIGVGYIGFYDTDFPEYNTCTLLYEGNPEGGKLLAVALDSDSKGTAQSKDIVEIIFPSSIVPEQGKTYTIVCNNSFPLYNLATGKTIRGGALNWQENPQTFTFVGGKSSSSELLFQKSSLVENSDITSITSATFEFNEDISIAQNKQIQIYKGEELITSSKSIAVDPENAKSLTVIFDEITLFLGNQYTIKLPEGIVCLKSDELIVNKPVEIKVYGTSTIRVSVKSIFPETNSSILPDKAEIKFNIETGLTLTPPDGVDHKRSIEFYKNEISDENFIRNFIGTASGDGIKWNLSQFEFEPETKYILRKKADDITVWIGKTPQPAYGNEEVIINFTTPSVEELGCTPITVGAAKIGNYDDASSPEFVNGGTYANISDLEIKRAEYVYNGNTFKPNLNYRGDHNALIYDVTDGTRKLVKELEMFTAGRGGDNDGGIVIYDYSVFSIHVNMDFLQEHTYEIVIPKGAIRMPSSEYTLYNYIMNDEIVYTVKGATPTVFTVDGCSVENNAEMSALPPAIVWTLNGAYDLKNSSVIANGKSTGTSPTGGYYGATYKLPVTIQKNGYKSHVAVHLINTETGENMAIHEGEIVTITIPAGSIVYPGEESLANPELTVSVKGIKAVLPEPEMVNVNLTVNGLHTTAHQSPKGKAYTFNFAPASEWIVESVKHGDKKLESNAEGQFITEPLDADADLNAELAYNGNWAVDEENTGIWTVPDTEIRIYKDEAFIVVDGVTSANAISVYNVAGMLINTTNATDGNDRVRITVAPSQIYIVTVDGVAAKIQM